MDESEMRDLLSKRLYLELQLFKDSVLRKEKEDIFKSSFHFRARESGLQKGGNRWDRI